MYPWGLARFLQYIRQKFNNKTEKVMFITAIIASFIGFAPTTNVPSKPVKQEVVRQHIKDTEMAFYNIADKKKGRK